jgi:pimeloyl-ACP methyl ester carboxylesterase
MPEAQVNGVRLAYQQLGHGPDLVLVHGLATSRAFWFAQYALPLARRFRVTLYDLRGHGYSERPASGYDAAMQAQDLAALLAHLRIERCALAGHSYGGAIALEYAVRAPERVWRLALLDSKINALQPYQRLSDAPYLTPFEKEVAQRFPIDWEREPQVGLRFLEVMARWRLGNGNASERDVYTPFGEGGGALRGARQWLDLLEQTAAAEEFVRPGAPAEAIARLSMPLLLIYGERSRCLPSCQALQRLLPQTQVEIVSGSGHFFPATHARETLAWLAEFFDGTDLRAGSAARSAAASTPSLP